MPRTRRQHDHVAGPRSDHNAAVAAELYCHFAAVDAERFVRIAVEVMKRVDAVTPRSRPAVAIEQFLENRSRLSRRNNAEQVLTLARERYVARDSVWFRH